MEPACIAVKICQLRLTLPIVSRVLMAMALS